MEKKGFLVSVVLIILLSLQCRLCFGMTRYDTTIIIICASLSHYILCFIGLCCYGCVYLISLVIPTKKPKQATTVDLSGPVDLALPPNSTLPTVQDTESRTTTLSLPSYSEALNKNKYPQIVNV